MKKVVHPLWYTIYREIHIVRRDYNLCLKST